MRTHYIILGVVVVVLFVLTEPARVRWLSQWFKKNRPEKIVQFAGLVPLKWGKYFWEGKTVLRSWAGFQERLGPYAWESSPEPSTGEVHLFVDSPDENDPKNPAPPSESQTKAFLYLQENDQLLQQKVLKAIFDVYPKWRESYRSFLGERFEQEMPVLNSPLDLKSVMGLSTIHILSVDKDGLAYVGFEFGCTWEEEHGLGVMSYRDNIVDVGSAEESFSLSVANEDGSKG